MVSEHYSLSIQPKTNWQWIEYRPNILYIEMQSLQKRDERFHIRNTF